MSEAWTFETAAEFWDRHRAMESEDVWTDYVAAEAFILDHTPASPDDAGRILDVLLDQGPGWRCDGRDEQALQRLRSYIRRIQSDGSASV